MQFGPTSNRRKNSSTRCPLSNKQPGMSERSPATHGSEESLPQVIPADAIDPVDLNQDALRVISRLERQGHEAYLVGGCVRDLLIGRQPKDFDVATSAHPRQIKRLFRNGRIIGRRFRLVHIYYGPRIIETSTFRTDPGAVSPEAGEDLLILEDNEFGTAEEDARRRDFTVNGLFLDTTQHEVIDYVGGLEDLEGRILRTIGDPMVRLAEDPVRILRAIKFATRLGFRIEDATWAAMRELSSELERAAAPRVLEEILRLLRSGSALGAFRMLRACGALAVILPQIDDHLGPRETATQEQNEAAERFWRLLEALDSWVHSRNEAPSTALCLSVLFYGIFEDEEKLLDEEEVNPSTLQDLIWELMDPLVIPARLSRRECGRARRIMLQQRRFSQTPNRRFRPLLFMRGEEFLDSLELFGLRTAAWGQGWDLYEGWKARYKRALEATPEELEEERRKTRRRRRKRRGKRRGSGSSSKSETEMPPEEPW